VSETVSLDFELKSPIERVWHALTDAATLSQWMFFETDDFEPVVGHRFRMRGKAYVGVIEGEILAVDAPHRLSFTWVTEGQLGPSATQVTWTLATAADGATRLHLEHSGFAREATRETAGAKHGWTAQIGQLQTLLLPA